MNHSDSELLQRYVAEKAEPAFAELMGWPEVRPFLKQTNFNWIRNRAREFNDGTYSQDLGGPLVLGGDNPGYMLKFGAPDYEPFISPLFQEGQGDIHLDVTLRPAKWSIVTVLKPNGLPAAGADVGLVSPGANLKLGQGHFVNNPLSNYGAGILAADSALVRRRFKAIRDDWPGFNHAR